MTNNKKNKFFRWLLKKIQIVIYKDSSYDVIKKYHFRILGLISLLLGVFLLYFIILSLLTIYTPVKYLIPGYPDKETRTLIYENAIKTDSLIHEVDKRDVYLNMLRDAILNEVPIDEDFVVPVENLTHKQIKEFNNPKYKRQTIECKTKPAVIDASTMPELFPPIKGIVVAKFNKIEKHYGTDIASSGETFIAATLSGTVIMTDYTVSTGYTIIIQHKNKLVSVYKHNKTSFVKAGQMVETGEHIAEYGNSGEDTNGEHLHFELWRDGTPINPEDYIIFE